MQEIFIIHVIGKNKETYAFSGRLRRRGRMVAENGKVLTYPTFYDAERYANTHDLPLDYDIAVNYDLNRLTRWLAGKEELTELEVARFFRLLESASYEIDVDFSGTVKSSVLEKIYEKLFGGNPDKTGYCRVPEWGEEELAALKKLIKEYLDRFVVALGL